MQTLRCYSCARSLPDSAFLEDAARTARRCRAYWCQACQERGEATSVDDAVAGNYTRWALDDDGVPYRLRG